MTIALIAAYDKNRAIGKNNQLPWRLPDDMKWFKKHTLNHAVVMGRKTFNALNNKPLSQRINIVLTQNPSYNTKGIITLNRIDDALNFARVNEEETLFVIGGQQIYTQFLPIADTLYITEVNTTVTAPDAFFPSFEKADWEEVFCEHHAKDEKHAHSFFFKIFTRILD